MLNYHEYAKTADLSKAAALIEYAANRTPQADKEWKNRVLVNIKKNVDGITRVKKGVDAYVLR